MGLKMLLICSFLMVLVGSANTQTLEEWTQQKKLQTRYKVNQIIAQEAFLKEIKKGYELVGSGWDWVTSIQKGKREQHQKYFNSMSQVHPLLKSYSGIGQMLDLVDRKIVRVRKELLGINELDQVEVRFFSGINLRISKKSQICRQQFNEFLKEGIYQMTEGERVQVLERLSHDVLNLILKIDRLLYQVFILEFERRKGKQVLEQMKGFYEVK